MQAPTEVEASGDLRGACLRRLHPRGHPATRAGSPQFLRLRKQHARAKQLARATAEFESIPNSCQVRLDSRMTVRDFKMLRDAATKAGVSVQHFLQQAVDQRIADLLKKK